MRLREGHWKDARAGGCLQEINHVTLERSAPGMTDSIETGKCPDEDASCTSGFCAGTGLPVVLAQNTKALVTVRRRYASHASSCW